MSSVRNTELLSLMEQLLIERLLTLLEIDTGQDVGVDTRDERALCVVEPQHQDSADDRSPSALSLASVPCCSDWRLTRSMLIADSLPVGGGKCLRTCLYSSLNCSSFV